MTGYYIRFGGKTRDIAELTDEELEEFVLGLDVDLARRWLIAMVKWIRDNVKEGPPDGSTAA